jgi:hypothetical protein
MTTAENTLPNRWPLRVAWFFAVAASLVAGLLLIRVFILEALLSSSRSVTTALIAGQPADDIKQRLATVATKHGFDKELDFGTAPYSADVLYFSHGISMIRVGASNGLVTDFEIRKVEFK